MSDEAWRVRLVDEMGGFGLQRRLMVYRRREGEKGVELLTCAHGEAVTVSVDPGGMTPDSTALLPAEVLPLLLEALTKEGVKMPEQSYIEGRADAMARHLGDMRRLVFEGRAKR